MRPSFWRTVLTVLLITSLGANVWLGRNAARTVLEVRESTAYLTWGTNYALNGAADMLEDPDWNSPAFRASLLEVLEWATIYSQSAGSTMSGLAVGPYHRVVTALNELSFPLSDYRTIAMRVAGTEEAVSAEHQTRLQGFAAHLQAAGWPRQSVHRDRQEEWTALAEALEQLLALENAQAGQ